jgi:beta-propeller repeat-containing protein
MFPTSSLDQTYNGEEDAFVTKLSSDGSALAYSTFLGGDLPTDITDGFATKLNTDGTGLAYSTFLSGASDSAKAIAIDAGGNAYLTGGASSGFPTTEDAFDKTYNGGADAYLLKLNGAGSALVYSTFLGGSNRDDGWAIAVDASGNAYVTGRPIRATSRQRATPSSDATATMP